MTARQRGGSELSGRLLANIQQGTLKYTYKGISTLKNPFDWALYPILLWEVRPQTIIEIGSASGGSAMWLADTMRTFGLPCHVHSLDIRKVTGLSIPDVTFHEADANQLQRYLSPAFLSALPRPLLVIEDASHQVAMCLAVLNFFHEWLRPGKYIIIEDGIITELGASQSYSGGPAAAIEQFLDLHPTEYEIDTRYCDWFGKNVTYAVNGFLHRRA